MQKKVLIVLADGFEELEAIAPIDILRRSGLTVVLAGLKNKSVVSARQVRIDCDTLLDQVQGDFDAIILPGGGIGAQNLAASMLVQEWVVGLFKAGKIVAAICASPALVLAPSGILDGLRVTGYPGVVGFSKQSIVVDQSVVVDQNVITARGPGVAAAFALTVLEQLCGQTVRQKIQTDMLI